VSNQFATIVQRGMLDSQNQRIGLGIRVDILLTAGMWEDAQRALEELEPLTMEDDLLSQTFNLKRRGLLAIPRGELEEGTSEHDPHRRPVARSHAQARNGGHCQNRRTVIE